VAKLVSLPKVPKADAVGRIYEIAQKETHRVLLLDHAHMRMLERDITHRQVFKVLRHGNPTDGPAWESTGEPGWKCVFRRITAGERIDVVAKLIERDGQAIVLVLTVFKG